MLIDSNILIYSLNQASPKQAPAQTFLRQQAELIFAQQNIFETIRILTHSKFPNPFTIDEAVKAVRTITNHARVICPTLETQDLALELIQKYRVTGTEIFDAYLVATAISNEIDEIATDNLQHLEKYQEIRIVNPFL